MPVSFLALVVFEASFTIGVWAQGLLILAVLYDIALGLKFEERGRIARLAL